MAQPRGKRPIYSEGFVKPGFGKVLDVFQYNLENDIERGGTFAAYYRGELVVNIWGGYADRKAKVRWKKDMMPCFYSTTKSPSAAVIGHLVDRGILDYSQRVCKYWPEFAANGKQDITLETLVTNRAGLSCTEESFTLALSKDDPEKLGQILANQKPLWTPGSHHGYHPMTFGLYLDQIVRRVDSHKRSLSQYFHEEMAIPFGLDFTIGLPYKEQYKAPRVVIMKALDQEDYIMNFKGDLSIRQLITRNPSDFVGVYRINDPDIRVLPVGSLCGHGTAESMAKFHAILGEGGSWQGKQLLSRATVERFQQIKSAGFDLAFSMDGMWSYGMMLFPVKEQGKPTMFMFGHVGFGGQMGLADTTYRVGLAYATSHLIPTSRIGVDADRRWPSMYNTLYKCIHQIENIKVPRKTFYLYEDYKKALEGSKL